jgi:hypothetical protein
MESQACANLPGLLPAPMLFELWQVRLLIRPLTQALPLRWTCHLKESYLSPLRRRYRCL